MAKFLETSLYHRLITGLIFLIIFLGTFIKFPTLFSFLIFFILSIILIFEYPLLFKINKISFWLVAPLYPILPFIFIIFLNTQEYRILLLNLFILVFCFDTGSYIFGKLFGKNKLCPKISPGKTVEGFVGGFLFVIISLIIFLSYFKKEISLVYIFLFSLIFSILALFGDLFESFLKRKVNIKDSGYFLPGHGGFLDRFDSVMFLSYFYYIFKNYLSIIFN